MHTARSVGIVAFPELTLDRPLPEYISLAIATIDASRAHAILINGRWYKPVETPEETLHLHTHWQHLTSETHVPIRHGVPFFPGCE